MEDLWSVARGATSEVVRDADDFLGGPEDDLVVLGHTDWSCPFASLGVHAPAGLVACPTADNAKEVVGRCFPFAPPKGLSVTRRTCTGRSIRFTRGVRIESCPPSVTAIAIHPRVDLHLTPTLSVRVGVEENGCVEEPPARLSVEPENCREIRGILIPRHTELAMTLEASYNNIIRDQIQELEKVALGFKENISRDG